MQYYNRVCKNEVSPRDLYVTNPWQRWKDAQKNESPELNSQSQVSNSYDIPRSQQNSQLASQKIAESPAISDFPKRFLAKLPYLPWNKKRDEPKEAVPNIQSNNNKNNIEPKNNMFSEMILSNVRTMSKTLSNSAEETTFKLKNIQSTLQNYEESIQKIQSTVQDNSKKLETVTAEIQNLQKWKDLINEKDLAIACLETQLALAKQQEERRWEMIIDTLSTNVRKGQVENLQTMKEELRSLTQALGDELHQKINKEIHEMLKNKPPDLVVQPAPNPVEVNVTAANSKRKEAEIAKINVLPKFVTITQPNASSKIFANVQQNHPFASVMKNQEGAQLNRSNNRKSNQPKRNASIGKENTSTVRKNNKQKEIDRLPQVKKFQELQFQKLSKDTPSSTCLSFRKHHMREIINARVLKMKSVTDKKKWTNCRTILDFTPSPKMPNRTSVKKSMKNQLKRKSTEQCSAAPPVRKRTKRKR